MNITKVIFARRSVRSYLPDPISKAMVHSLLEEAVQAPSAMNAQPWLFAVVQDRERLKHYSDLAKQRLLARMEDEPLAPPYAAMLRDENFNIFYDAGVLVVIGSATRTRFSEADCWLAAGQLMLAARAQGLGTCCIGFALDLLNTDALKTELGIPLEGEVVAAIIVGYPTAFPPPVARNAPKVTVWFGDDERTSEGASAEQRERHAREHPAGYLASRPPPPATEHVGHPALKDDPGFGAFGHHLLNEGERELSLASPLPEALLNRARKRGQDDE